MRVAYFQRSDGCRLFGAMQFPRAGPALRIRAAQARTQPRRCGNEVRARYATRYMRSIIAWPKAEVETCLAPGISRAKS
jgi:hypothetical protein